MRLLPSTAIVCLSLISAAAAIAADSSAVGAGSAAPAPDAAASGGDAAARHAKRTACLKDAKARKLVGADKTAFIKRCIEAP